MNTQDLRMPPPITPAMNELKRKRIGWVVKSLFILAVAGTVLITIISAVVFWYFSRGLPQLISAEDYKPPGVTRILGNNGKEDSVLGEFYSQRRYVIPYEKIPKNLVN